MKKAFFYLFIFFLPWQTRLILTPEKPEFLSFSIYLSEIFLWLALAFWLTNTDLKKIPSTPPLQRGEAAKTPPFGKGRLGGIFIFCFFIFLSIVWSSDRVAAFRLWLFIFDGIMVYIFLQNFIPPLKAEDVQNQTPPLKVRGGRGELWGSRTGLIYVFLFSLFIISVFGIWQFFNLGSPALKWLGLSARGAWNLGDIVVQTDGARWLRAYGPFPHPNIFGGYLAAGLIILFHEIKIKTQMIRSYHLCFFYFLSSVLFFALFLTFSRSAGLALALVVIYFVFEIYKKFRYAKCSAVADDFVKRGGRQILIFLIFLCFLAIAFSIIFWPMLRTRATSAGRLEQKSNTERVASWKDGITSWKQNPFFGSGLGSDVIASDSEAISLKMGSPRSLQSLAMTAQPAHNIFILVLSQLGIVGFAIYLFLWRGFWKNPAVRPLLILFFIIGFFDHYLWTLYSGSMLFWLGLSLFLNENG